MCRCEDYISHYETDGNEFNYFHNEDSQASAFDVLFRKFVVRLAGRQNEVVDIGSGGGWTSVIPHKRMILIDLSRKNLKSLRSDSAWPILADAHRLSLKDESVDFVIASEIFEHLNEPAVAALEVLRVLRPGGKAIITTPYKEKIRYTLCIHCNKPTPWNAHLHSFDAEKLSSIFPVGKRRTYLLGSKVFALLRLYRLLRWLPIAVWRMLDWVANKLLDKAAYLVLVIEK